MFGYIYYVELRGERYYCERYQPFAICGNSQDAQGSDEPTEGAVFKCIFYHSGKNNLGKAGARLLVKAELPLLEKLFLGNYLE